MRLHAVKSGGRGLADDEGNEVRSVKNRRRDTKAAHTWPGWPLALDMAADLEYVRGSRLQHLDAYTSTLRRSAGPTSP